MAYVQVPKDLTRVKTKVMFNLTQRQLVCFTLAAAAGIPFYLLTKNSMGSTLSACLMIVVIAYPFAIALGLFFAFMKISRYRILRAIAIVYINILRGTPLEKILMNIYRQKIQRPGVRVYRTRNMYRVIQDEIYEKEVLGIESDGKAVQKGQRKAGRKKTG